MEALSSDVTWRRMISEKEQEVNRLRQETLSALEHKLSEKQQDLLEANKKLEELEGDFRYNLTLLDQRDVELEEYDRVFAALNAQLEDKEHAISQLNMGLAEAKSELKIERDKNQELEDTFNRQRVCLEKALEDERLKKEETILRLKEEWEAQKRQLQRGLAEADGEIERQRRELSGGFSVELHALELKYQQRTEEAIAAMAHAESAAQQSAKEMKIALEREQKQAELAESAIGKMREKEDQLENLTWELENMKRLKDDQILTLEGRCKLMDQHRKEAESHVSEAKGEVSQMKDSLERERRVHQKEIQDLKTHLAQDRHETKIQLQQAEARVSELLTEREEFMVEAASKRSELQVEVSQIKEAHEREMLEMVQQFERTAKQRTAEMRELQEGSWLRETELQASREKLKVQRAALEEGHRMLEDFKEKLVTAGEHTRDLQRKIVQLELQLEVQLEEREAAVRAEVDGTIKKLATQRDEANAAVKAVESNAEEMKSMQSHIDALTKELLEVRSLQASMPAQQPHTITPVSALPSAHASETSELPTPPELDEVGFAASIAPETHCMDQEPGIHQDEIERLKSVISSMRQELENLQESSANPGVVDVRPILAELSACDGDLMQALEHVEVLQSQAKVPELRGAANWKPEELQYLRAKVKDLRGDNRKLRRHIMEIEMEQLKGNQKFAAEGCNVKENGDANTAQPDSNHSFAEEEIASLQAEVEQQRSKIESQEVQLKEALRHREVAAELKRQVKDLLDENDRLMELGNALRAERDRAQISSTEHHAFQWGNQFTGPTVTSPSPSLAAQSWPPMCGGPQNNGGTIWWGPETNTAHPWQQPIHIRQDPPQATEAHSSSPVHFSNVPPPIPSASPAVHRMANNPEMEQDGWSHGDDQALDPAPARRQNCDSGEEGGGLGSTSMNVHAVKGNKCGGRQERVCQVPKSVSDRSTPSQRAKLKVLQKRNEQRHVPRKIRNYNIKADEEVGAVT